jgi:hypothetical protein
MLQQPGLVRIPPELADLRYHFDTVTKWVHESRQRNRHFFETYPQRPLHADAQQSATDRMVPQLPVLAHPIGAIARARARPVPQPVAAHGPRLRNSPFAR